MNVVGQLYQFVRMGFEGYREINRHMLHVARKVGRKLGSSLPLGMCSSTTLWWNKQPAAVHIPASAANLSSSEGPAACSLVCWCSVTLHLPSKQDGALLQGLDLLHCGVR